MNPKPMTSSLIISSGIIMLALFIGLSGSFYKNVPTPPKIFYYINYQKLLEVQKPFPEKVFGRRRHSAPSVSSGVVTVNVQSADMDRDGFPDKAELIDEADRFRFRQWFTAIAESQFFAIHPDWPEIRHDCTGLICFAYKEALKTHDDRWLKRFKYITNPAIPDIKTYRYPGVPVIGVNLFRTTPGPFKEQDLSNNTFQPIATAQVMMDYNCQYLGKEFDETIMEGDLLFYRYYKDEHPLYHAMILVKKSNKTETEMGMDWVVVYHTGPDGNQAGEVRRVRIAELNRHPDYIWHAKPNNTCFLGFFRLNILDYRIID
jgi:uncharacterized protein